MQPITRKEMYLNRLAGQQAQAIPAEPITREEQYLGRLCGENNVIPEEPRTRKEIYLANLCGEDVTPPAEAITRIEQYMAFASGERETKPANPLTREEWYWDKYQGGDVPEEKTIAFTDIITVTDALARPAVDLQSEITATQNLNGYEHPWVGGAGKNKINVADLSGSASSYYVQFPTNFVLTEGVTYTFSADITTNVEPFNFTVGCGSATYQRDIKSYSTSSTATSGRLSITFTPTAEQLEGRPNLYIRAPRYGQSETFTYSVKNMQLELGSTATAYAPYENICPISGRTEVNVTRTGKNLCYASDSNLFPRGDNLPIINNASTLTAYAKVPKNTNLVFSCATEPFRKIPYGFTEEPQVGTIAHTLSYTAVTTTSYAFNSGEYEYVGFYYGSTDHSQTNVQIELGSTATAYEPYEGDTFNTELGRTVYGGTLDLTTGELKITHAYVDLGDLNWSKFADYNVFEATINDKKNGATNFITTSYKTVEKAFTVLENGETTSTNRFPVPSIFIKDGRVITPQDFKTLVTGQKMVYELATPQTISLTPTEVQMLENNNTIWADSGIVQLTYLSKAAQRVQSMNASLKANTLKITKAITGGVKA